MSATEILDRLALFGIRLGLENVRALLSALGDPHEDLKVVLVAGTNGKGSTSALLASMASQAGYRTGLYTSPHLESVRERLRIDGLSIPSQRLDELIERVVSTSNQVLGHDPTYFEAVTAAAFLYFAEESVDLAVLEVGMGGRLDATNVSSPILALITPIGLDHQEHLGDSLVAIAQEKAGILRPGKTALVWPGSAEAERALRASAQEVGAHLVLAEPQRLTVSLHGLAPARVQLETHQSQYSFSLPLLGRHQSTAAVGAVMAAELLSQGDFPRLTPASIIAGIEACRWPGRLELVKLPEGGRILLDGAHNPPAAEVLASFLAALGEPYDLLFGVMEDKPVEEILSFLAGPATEVRCTAPSGGRAMPPEDLAALLALSESRAGELEPMLTQATDAAMAASRLLVVTGSLYLVGEARAALTARFGVPAPAVAPLFLGS